MYKRSKFSRYDWPPLSDEGGSLNLHLSTDTDGSYSSDHRKNYKKQQHAGADTSKLVLDKISQSNEKMRTLRRSQQKRAQIIRMLEQSDEESESEKEEIFGKISQSNQKMRTCRRSPQKRAQVKRKLQQSEESESENEDIFGKKGTPRKPHVTNKLYGEMEISNTPLHNNGTSTSGYLREILQNQRDLLAQFVIVRRVLSDIKTELVKKKEDKIEPVQVSTRTRKAVKRFFSNAEDNQLSWDYQKSYHHETNKEMTEFIKASVKGTCHGVSTESLNAAVQRYFSTKKEASIRQLRNKDQLHRQRQATYERKKEKAKRRLHACDKNMGWTEETKTLVKEFLQSKTSFNYMSSDDEGQDGFISHPFSWESKTWRETKDSLDRRYLETCPVRSRRLLRQRTKGSIKYQATPNVEEKFAWIYSSEAQEGNTK